jgi:hypothetical protein
LLSFLTMTHIGDCNEPGKMQYSENLNDCLSNLRAETFQAGRRISIN